MWILELIVVLIFIWLGARLGSIGIGFAGGFGVLVLGFVFGLAPGSIPTDVILIIMGVIAAIAAMQEAGGLDYLVQIAEKILKSNPKHITFLAPIVTYTMTLFASTGHTAFSTLPVIAEVATREGIRPSRPLALPWWPPRLPSPPCLFLRPWFFAQLNSKKLGWIMFNYCSSPSPVLLSQ